MTITSVDIGRQAEAKAAHYLIQREYAIVDRNWRTRYCEIDLVARRYQTVYFVEVKYRRSSTYGRGLDYITVDKLRRMRFAAELWVKAHAWSGDYALSAIEVSGPQFEISSYLAAL